MSLRKAGTGATDDACTKFYTKKKWGNCYEEVKKKKDPPRCQDLNYPVRNCSSEVPWDDEWYQYETMICNCFQECSSYQLNKRLAQIIKNFDGERRKANYVYLTATLDAAIWGAELAVGDELGRIYRVEPSGTIENDPNLTDKKFPGNPKRSYRTKQPLRVVGEVLDWKGHSPEMFKKMTDHIEELKRLGIEAINE